MAKVASKESAAGRRGFSSDEEEDPDAVDELSPLYSTRALADYRRTASSAWALAGVGVAIALWIASSVLAALGVSAILPDSGGEPESVARASESHGGSSFHAAHCPCMCGDAHGVFVVPEPPTLPPPTPLSPFAMLPSSPRWTTARPLASDLVIPDVPRPSLPPIPVQPVQPVPSVIGVVPGDPSPVEDVHLGAAFVAKSAAPIYESITSWKDTRKLVRGEPVTAGGPPQNIGGYARLPIQPTGAIDMAVLEAEGRAREPSWECFASGLSDKLLPGFGEAAHTAKDCERDRGDGYEYRSTEDEHGHAIGAGCAGCPCCRRLLQPSRAPSRRLLGETQPEDLIVQLTTTSPIDLFVQGTGPLVLPQPWQVPQESDLSLQMPGLPDVPLAPSQQPWPLAPSQQPWAAAGEQAHADSQGQCRVGEPCAYGQGWCTKEGLQTLEPLGFCTKQECGGPAVHAFPNHTCGSPDIPQLNITSILSGLPKLVRWALSDIPWLNSKIAATLEWHGIEHLTVAVDEVLTQSFEWRLANSEATWQVGCWPSQRYVVTDGEVNFRSGRIRVEVGGFNLLVSAYNLKAAFRRLRGEIECHGGSWYLGGVGKDTAGTPVTKDRFVTSGELHVECEDKISVFCILLLVLKSHISEAAVASLPDFLTWWLGGVEQLWLGPGCPDPLHNTVAVLPYKSKECCEAAFHMDEFGCLVGGQFNGRHPSFRKVVRGVECKASTTTPGHFVARCDTLPGTYYEQTAGVCREADTFPDADCLGCGADWPPVRRGLHFLALADTLLSLCIAWCVLLCCFCRCSSGEGTDMCPASRFSSRQLESAADGQCQGA